MLSLANSILYYLQITKNDYDFLVAFLTGFLVTFLVVFFVGFLVVFLVTVFFGLILAFGVDFGFLISEITTPMINKMM